MKKSRRQRIRKYLLLVMVVLFPVIYNYFSPYVIIMGAAEGIIDGSFIVFSFMFLGSLFLGRVFCGWLCPAGATQELCLKVNKKDFKNGKRNWIKYFIWGPWLTIIALMFVQAGGIKTVDPLYQTYYGISVQDLPSVIIFFIVFSLIAGIAIAAGKRAACHTICWMSPFMIIGRRIRNSVGWPSLQLIADSSRCKNCKTCTRTCAMSLDVNAMVQKQSMEDSECILCGQCVDNCPNNVIKYAFSSKR